MATEDKDRLGNLVLARVAGTPSGVDKGTIAADLALFAGPQTPASRWRGAIEDAIETLAAAGLIAAAPGGLTATREGAAAAARFLGAPTRAALTWDNACDAWLIAKALGVKRTPARRLAVLGTAEGLRAAILIHAYGLRLKGEATPARLRQALAATALRRAFASGSAANLADKLGLSARASRLLAAQLMAKPREPGTDRRLVAALAAEACGAASADLRALRIAVLRRAFTVSEPPVGPPRPAETGREPTPAGPLQAPESAAHGGRASGVVEGAGIPTPDPQPAVAAPLDLPDFTLAVRRCAAAEAQGWAGDRKAYISHVWRSLRQRHPEWGLSEIAFKGMLAEAHRAGHLALVNADLKDASNIRDVQDSALIYKNAVFHFIRVDA